MDINLICVGKIKEKYLEDGINEYAKRIKPFCNLKITEIKESNFAETNKNLNQEAALILKEIKKDDFVITLEIEGKMLTSVEMAQLIEKHTSYSSRTITFVIGSSEGLSNEVKMRSDYKLSFSKMTFPHQLMRMIFLEQLYRSFSILNNKKYHK